jgi:hypothetical protein
MISFIIKGTQITKQDHGRVKPWNSCKRCHIDEVAQGSITLRKSYGHAQHVFMQNISCSQLLSMPYRQNVTRDGHGRAFLS